MNVSSHNFEFRGAASSALILIAASARMAAALSTSQSQAAGDPATALNSPANSGVGPTMHDGAPPQGSVDTYGPRATAPRSEAAAHVSAGPPALDERLKAALLAIAPPREPTTLAIA